MTVSVLCVATHRNAIELECVEHDWLILDIVCSLGICEYCSKPLSCAVERAHPSYEATHLGQQLGYFSCVQSLHQLLKELDINFAV